MKKFWLRFKKWAIGILIALGLVSVPFIVGAGSKDFSWTNPTQNTDGSVFDAATELKEIRIYCTNTDTNVLEPMITSVGVATTYTAEFSSGNYSCYATAVSIEDAESFASNTVTFTIDPLIPNPPVLTQ